MTTIPAGLAVEPNQCHCHPETCCCAEYRLVSDDWILMKGSREQCDTIYALLADYERLREMEERVKGRIDAMVDRFLCWPLPTSVRVDLCCASSDGLNRTGTNLLTADEARQMLVHVIGVEL